jgi:hypothetical protein
MGFEFNLIVSLVETVFEVVFVAVNVVKRTAVRAIGK